MDRIEYPRPRLNFTQFEILCFHCIVLNLKKTKFVDSKYNNYGLYTMGEFKREDLLGIF